MSANDPKRTSRVQCKKVRGCLFRSATLAIDPYETTAANQLRHLTRDAHIGWLTDKLRGKSIMTKFSRTQISGGALLFAMIISCLTINSANAAKVCCQWSQTRILECVRYCDPRIKTVKEGAFKEQSSPKSHAQTSKIQQKKMTKPKVMPSRKVAPKKMRTREATPQKAPSKNGLRILIPGFGHGMM